MFTDVNCINVINTYKTKYTNFILTLNVIFIACIFYTLYSSWIKKNQLIGLRDKYPFNNYLKIHSHGFLN